MWRALTGSRKEGGKLLSAFINPWLEVLFLRAFFLLYFLFRVVDVINRAADSIISFIFIGLGFEISDDFRGFIYGRTSECDGISS